MTAVRMDQGTIMPDIMQINNKKNHTLPQVGHYQNDR